MSLQEKLLMKWYRHGFTDELHGTNRELPTPSLIRKAYRIGREHAYIGDEVSSIDNLTEEQIIQQIKN